MVLILYVVTRDYFRLQGTEIYSLLVIHAYRSLVCALHMLNYDLSTAFSHVNVLQPGVSQSNNVLSWKLFYWFFFPSCFFVNLMFLCTVTAFLPSNQHYCSLCFCHAFYFFGNYFRLFKENKDFPDLAGFNFLLLNLLSVRSLWGGYGNIVLLSLNRARVDLHSRKKL